MARTSVVLSGMLASWAGPGLRRAAAGAASKAGAVVCIGMGDAACEVFRRVASAGTGGDADFRMHVCVAHTPLCGGVYATEQFPIVPNIEPV